MKNFIIHSYSSSLTIITFWCQFPEAQFPQRERKRQGTPAHTVTYCGIVGIIINIITIVGIPKDILILGRRIPSIGKLNLL